MPKKINKLRKSIIIKPKSKADNEKELIILNKKREMITPFFCFQYFLYISSSLPWFASKIRINNVKKKKIGIRYLP